MGGRVRFVIELHHTTDGVEGDVMPEGASETQPFRSWLELLRLLEQSPQRGAEER
jgi:hypothetical protein